MERFTEIFRDNSQHPAELTAGTPIHARAWHTIERLEQVVAKGNVAEQADLLTIIYLNASFLVGAPPDIYPKWINSLNTLVTSCQVSPVFQAIAYVILLMCLQHQEVPNLTEAFENLRRQQGKAHQEFATLLQFLKKTRPKIANAIEAYYAVLFQQQARYQACMEKAKVCTISLDLISANEACVLLRGIIANSDELVAQSQALVEILTAEGDNFSINRVVNFVYALCMMSFTDKQRIALAKIFFNAIPTLLRLSQQTENQKELSTIIGFILTHVSQENRIALLHLMQGPQWQIKDNHPRTANSIEKTFVLALCQFLSHASLASTDMMAVLTQLPYKVLMRSIGYRLCPRNAMISLFQHVFNKLTSEELKQYCTTILFNVLTQGISDEKYENQIEIAQVFGKALSKQSHHIIDFLVKDIFKSNLFSYHCLAFFLAELIFALPEKIQINYLQSTILPLLKVEDKKLFIIKLLVGQLGEILFSQDSNFDDLQIPATPFLRLITSEKFLSVPVQIWDLVLTLNAGIQHGDSTDRDYFVIGIVMMSVAYLKRENHLNNDNNYSMEILSDFIKNHSQQYVSKSENENAVLPDIEFLNVSAIHRPEVFYGIFTMIKCSGRAKIPDVVWEALCRVVEDYDHGKQDRLSLCLSELVTTCPQSEKIKKLETLNTCLEDIIKINRHGISKDQSRRMALVFERNILTICYVCKKDVSLPLFMPFLKRCYELLQNENPFVKTMAQRAILLLSPVAPMSFRLRAIQNLSFHEFEDNKLTGLITSLDEQYAQIGIDAYWRFLQNYNLWHAEVEPGRLEILRGLKAFRFSTARIQFITKIAARVREENDLRFYTTFFNMMKSAFLLFEDTNTAHQAIAIVVAFLRNVYDDIRTQVLETLLSVPNPAFLVQSFEDIFALCCTENEKLRVAVYAVLAKMLPHLSPYQVKILYNLTREDDDVFKPKQPAIQPFNIEVLLEIGRSKDPMEPKRIQAEYYILHHLALARTAGGVSSLVRELLQYQNQLGFLHDRRETKQLGQLSLSKTFSPFAYKFRNLAGREEECSEAWTRLLNKCIETLKKFDITTMSTEEQALVSKLIL